MAGNFKNTRIGILALQGCVEPHRPHFEATGAQVQLVRKSQDFNDIHGLVLPGGESTTMLKLLKILDMEESLTHTFRKIPCWGICAGAILMAKEVHHPEQKSFGAIDIGIDRNAYGRQLDSFNTRIQESEVSFIRAPKINRVGKDVRILASYEGQAVWVQSGKHMVTTFHPELGTEQPSHMHAYFAKMLQENFI